MSEFIKKPLVVESILPGSRLSYPLKLILAKTYVKDNIVLIGWEYLNISNNLKVMQHTESIL